MQTRTHTKLPYRPARLYTGKDWYVGFYVENAETGKLVRIKHRLNHIEGEENRREVAREMIRTINADLAKGWNPLRPVESADRHLVLELLSRFMKIKQQEQTKQGHDSYKTYQRIFTGWLKDKKCQRLMVDEFDSTMAARFMEYIYEKRSKNAHTYNGYLMFFKSFWNWMIEFDYATDSPLSKLKPKRRPQKTRTVIPPPVRADIRDYLQAENPGFLVVCYLVFHTLIRPVEITRLRVRDVNLKAQVIVVPASASKNGKQRVSTVPNVLMPVLVDYLDGAVLRDFLVTPRLRPGRDPATTRMFRYHWQRVQKELGLPKSYMFYSLRDSGIVQKLQDQISPEEVMKQAGHWSLEITTMYVNHFSPTGSEQVKSKATQF